MCVFFARATVVPNAMESLRPIQLSPNSVTVSWKVPFNLGLFPPGLEFRAAYQILTTWTDVNVFYVSFIIIIPSPYLFSLYDYLQDKSYLELSTKML